MKVKKVKIAIKGTKKALAEFVQAGEAIERGKKVKPEKRGLCQFVRFSQCTDAKTTRTLAYHQRKTP